MKRLRSSDDLDSYNDNNNNKSSSSSMKDSSSHPGRSSSRGFYYKSDNVRKGMVSASSSSARYDRDRSVDEDGRESSRMVRKRSDHDFDGFDRRKGLGLGFDRYSSRDGYAGGGGSCGSGGGGGDRLMHRSESFCGGGSRREFPKGFRSERDRSRREGSVSSWRRFGKEFEESSRGGGGGGGSRGGGAGEDRNSGPAAAAAGAATRSSPKILRDVKSPTWSRDSGSEQTRVVARGGGRGDEGGKGRSSNSRSRSSPTWSKESESEQQSKSVEVGRKNAEVETKSADMETKSVDMEVKSVDMETKSVENGSSSEMEEGELQPEPKSDAKVVKEGVNQDETEGKQNVKLDGDSAEVDSQSQVQSQVNEGVGESCKAVVSDEKEGVKEANEMNDCGEESLNCAAGVSENAAENLGFEVGRKGQDVLKGERECQDEVKGNMDVEKPVYFEGESKKEKGIDLEVRAEDDEVPETRKEVMVENVGVDANRPVETESLSQKLKDKGKGLAISPTAADSVENGMWVERESRNVTTQKDGEDDVEGPSTRGFELFTSSPVRRSEKPEHSGIDKSKDEKLAVESLDLSLSLPNVLLPIGATKDTVQAPGSPSHGKSVQSFSTFRTNSDGFTASMSFSGSQSFFHNPSCSLTQNSLDMDNYEQSVHSRPIFQGIDWQSQGQNDSKHKDVPLYQRILMNGNGSLHQSQVLQGASNGQPSQGTSKVPNGLEKQLSFQKQLSVVQARNHGDARSPSQSVGSQDVGSQYSFEKKRAMREKHGGSLYRSNSQKEQEQFLIGGADFVETVISRIVSDPIHVMARKLHEMTAQSASCLKESIREIMLNADKQGQLCAFQSALHNQSDLTLDMLLKTHRTQLEILVSIKTGLPEYLQVDNAISSSDLAEVFLNLRCRNLACRAPLPVDECDCKVCGKKNGFCSACMCLVCSKFDTASNTCSWVGCDFCLHWCHADCALRESHIRNGQSATGVLGTSEMQFHCVACDHPSEMFGFVKEVFQNFAKDWTAEAFCKELEYVKRIFGASKDMRGRRLHEIADQLLAKLANKSNLLEVYSRIMGFLTDSDASKFGNASHFSGKEQGNGSSGVVAGPSRDTAWLKSVYADKAAQLERSADLLPSFHSDLNDKRPVESDMQRSAQKEPLFDELESIVRIKDAEAKMFQSRADEARREAEGLKRIAVAKKEKIEEEYASRIRKLRLVEAEEIRKQKFEEFQALERAHREYFSMKMRMEADIKDLLLKMETTKRNLPM